MRVKDFLKLPHRYAKIVDENREVSHISNHSKECDSLSCFVAVKGFKQDGHHYIAELKQLDIPLFLVEEIPADMEANFIQVDDCRKALSDFAAHLYGHADMALKKIAITGTNGKTSTSYFTRQLLELFSEKAGMIGTIQYHDGLKATPATHTSPESHVLHALYRKMRDNQCHYCVQEVSSHALVLNRVYNLIFETAVFTNFTQDHLDFHGTMTDYFAAKKRLFDMHLNGTAVLNFDDEFVRSIAYPKIISFGQYKSADLRLLDFQLHDHGSLFSISYQTNTYVCEIPLLAYYNILNVLAATAVLISLGYSIQAIIDKYAQLKPVPGRMELLPMKNRRVIVDYAHSPDALENVLKSAKEICKGSLIVVFGCGGDRDKTKRPLMARAVEHYADQIIVSSDNPRTEDPELIIDDICTGFSKSLYHRQSDRKKAIIYACDIADTNDIVVIAGKGHESYQEIQGVKYHFDDVEVAMNWEKNAST